MIPTPLSWLECSCQSFTPHLLTETARSATLKPTEVPNELLT